MNEHKREKDSDVDTAEVKINLTRLVMALEHGPEAHSSRRNPLGTNPLLRLNKIMFRV
jgi:hypothetical protein